MYSWIKPYSGNVYKNLIQNYNECIYLTIKENNCYIYYLFHYLDPITMHLEVTIN